MRIHGLTPQQWRVAGLVADGEPDKVIAAALHVELSCVGFHVRRIVKAWKLVASKNRRAQITRRYVEITLTQTAA